MSQTKVPFYEYVRELELSSRQYFSLEEIREKYISWIMTQPLRHAQLKLGDDSAVPLLISNVKEVRVLEKDKRRSIERSNARYALPAAQVDRMIEDRRQKLLTSHLQSMESEEQEIAENRWQKPATGSTRKKVT